MVSRRLSHTLRAMLLRTIADSVRGGTDMKPNNQERRATWSWAFYDWANSAYATVVIAGFFPVFFQSFWSTGVDPAVATSRLGFANGLSGAIIALSAPFLGAIADYAGAKRRLLGLFMLLGVLCTAALSFVEAGAWFEAAALFVLANVGFMGANVFYDALLVAVSRRKRLDFVSGLGYGMGYLGGGLLFAGAVAATLKPELFGLADQAQAVQASFVATAIWWLIFALPLFLWVREPAPRLTSYRAAVAAGMKQVAMTLRRITKMRQVGLFLLAYWLYIDGVHTVITMAVGYGAALGFGTEQLISALLLVQFVGFPAAILFGKLGERIGAKRGIFLGLAVYVGVSVWGVFLSEPWEFFGIAVLVGMVQGGVQALSRSYYARLIPEAESGEFFGFYNLLGKFATLIGPPLFGLFGLWFGQRYSMLAVIILFVAGGLLLARVREEKAIGAQFQALSDQP